MEHSLAQHSNQQASLSQGQTAKTVFAVESSWLANWCTYLKTGTIPGKLRTHQLLNSSGKLRSDLQPQTDYMVLNETDWQRLSAKFGAESAVPLSFGQCDMQPVSLPFKMFVSLQGCPEVTGDDEPVSRRRCFPDTFTVFTTGDDTPRSYFSASLQLLLTAAPFCRYLLETEVTGFPLHDHLVSFVKSLAEKDSVPPPLLYRTLSRYFPATVEHDAARFCHYLIKEIGAFSPLATKCFAGTAKQVLRCSGCGAVVTYVDEFCDIRLDFNNSIRRSLHGYLRENTVRQYDPCQECNSSTSIRSIELLVNPEYLLLHIERFSSRMASIKLSHYVKFQDRLELSDDSSAHAVYTLVGIIVHEGSPETGYYYTLCKRRGSWYKIHDSCIKQVELRQVLQEHAYILLYRIKE